MTLQELEAELKHCNKMIGFSIRFSKQLSEEQEERGALELRQQSRDWMRKALSIKSKIRGLSK